MKRCFFLFFAALGMMGCKNQGTPTGPKPLHTLPFGSVKPLGWLQAQMRYDLDGMVGHLPRLAPVLFTDSIYGSARIHPRSAAPDLGNLKSGDAEGDDQYKWWNSETQSNTWDGIIRHVLLVGTPEEHQRIDAYVQQMLRTQDTDGYLGIYSPELRYRFQSENGELWAKTTLFRGLMAYWEATGDQRVFAAIQKAVEETMNGYPIHRSQPFFAGSGFTGGVSHGLNFTDVLEMLYQRTGDLRYRTYAVFLYTNFSQNHASEADAQKEILLTPGTRLMAHGVHTYEHLRPLALAALASGDTSIQEALQIYLERLEEVVTVTGGPIGDEWIAGRKADAGIGYEFCSLHELCTSYAHMQLWTADARFGDLAENIFFNAAQGARDPYHSAIAYLKTDNSFEMTGTCNGEPEPGRIQTRYKYSPVHQDVAVCCAPNAGRITPYFLQMSWLQQKDTLVHALLAPSELKIGEGKDTLRIRCETDYPYGLSLRYAITQPSGRQRTIKIRRPSWAHAVQCSESFREENGFLVISRIFGSDETFTLSFSAEPEAVVQGESQHYFRRGPLVYALDIPATPAPGERVYDAGFQDWFYPRTDFLPLKYVPGNDVSFREGKLWVNLVQPATGEQAPYGLIPIGKTALRQAAF